MTDTEWRKLTKLMAELWPTWKPNEGQTREFHYRLTARPFTTVEKAIRDHFSKDEYWYMPKLSLILAHCIAISESDGNKAAAAGITYEAREQMRLSNLDDAIALETIRSWKPERLAAAVAVAVASECIQAVPRSDPEAWTKNERGFIVAADWMRETQPSRAQAMLDAKDRKGKP